MSLKASLCRRCVWELSLCLLHPVLTNQTFSDDSVGCRHLNIAKQLILLPNTEYFLILLLQVSLTVNFWGVGYVFGLFVLSSVLLVWFLLLLCMGFGVWSVFNCFCISFCAFAFLLKEGYGCTQWSSAMLLHFSVPAL